MNQRSIYKRWLAASGMTSKAVAEKLRITPQALYSRIKGDTTFLKFVEILEAMGYKIYLVGPDKKAKPIDD